MKPILLIALFLAAPKAAQAQREFALDFRPFGGVLSLAWRTAPTLYAGIGLGGGIDMLDKTFVPDTEKEEFHALDQLLHASVFLRVKPARWDLDVGVRAGFAEVRNCFASDCWPGTYVGAYANAFWGGRRFKAGPRLLIARVMDNDDSDSVVYLEILTGRLRIN